MRRCPLGASYQTAMLKTSSVPRVPSLVARKLLDPAIALVEAVSSLRLPPRVRCTSHDSQKNRSVLTLSGSTASNTTATLSTDLTVLGEALCTSGLAKVESVKTVMRSDDNTFQTQ